MHELQICAKKREEFQSKNKQNNQQSQQKQRYYLVDKKTLKVSFFELENDFLGNVSIDYPIWNFDGEYFVKNMNPKNFSDIFYTRR